MILTLLVYLPEHITTRPSFNCFTSMFSREATQFLAEICVTGLVENTQLKKRMLSSFVLSSNVLYFNCSSKFFFSFLVFAKMVGWEP